MWSKSGRMMGPKQSGRSHVRLPCVSEGELSGSVNGRKRWTGGPIIPAGWLLAAGREPGGKGRGGAAVWGQDRKKNTDSRAVRRQDGPSIHRGGRRQQQQHHFIVLMALSVGGRRKKQLNLIWLCVHAGWLPNRMNTNKQSNFYSVSFFI